MICKRLITSALLLGLAAITALPAAAQTVAPTYSNGFTTLTAPGTFQVDQGGTPVSDNTNHALRVQCVTAGCQVTATPLYSAPAAYTSGTAVDMRAFGAITFTCTTAPSAGTVSISPDATNYVVQTAVLNNSAGINTTATVTAAGVYTIGGHGYFKANLTGGTCFIAGGQ